MSDVITGKSALVFEPKMEFGADQVEETQTPVGFRPTLGPVANLAYKVATLKYLIRFNQEPGGGALKIRVSGQGEIRAESKISMDSETLAGSVNVPLYGIEGDSDIGLAVEVESAADEGTAATIDAVLYVEQPVIVGR